MKRDGSKDIGHAHGQGDGAARPALDGFPHLLGKIGQMHGVHAEFGKDCRARR